MRKLKLNIADIEAAEEQIRKEMRIYDYDTLEYPLEVINEKYTQGLLEDENDIFIPDYQREFVWLEKRRAKFIESLLLNVPIPYLFFADVEGRKEIVDGSQRVRTIAEFIGNKLMLNGLEKLTRLNGFYFSDLTPTRQKRFLNRGLKVILLTEKTDASARQDLFERINTGSDELKVIENIKGAFQGEFYRFLQECSENDMFEELCPISDKRANREEGPLRILRYFAYTESLGTYQGTVGPFITAYVKTKKGNNFTHTEKVRLEKSFNDMLIFVKDNFAYGFRKNSTSKTTPRVRFEAISIGVHFALQENPGLHNVNTDWVNSNEFKDIVRSDAANNKSKVLTRINYVKNKLLEII